MVSESVQLTGSNPWPSTFQLGFTEHAPNRSATIHQVSAEDSNENQHFNVNYTEDWERHSRPRRQCMQITQQTTSQRSHLWMHASQLGDAPFGRQINCNNETQNVTHNTNFPTRLAAHNSHKDCVCDSHWHPYHGAGSPAPRHLHPQPQFLNTLVLFLLPLHPKHGPRHQILPDAFIFLHILPDPNPY